MKIRFANLEDIPAVVGIGKIVHAQTRFRIYDYDEALVAEKLRQLILAKENGKYVFFIADDSEGKPAGLLIGGLEQHIFSAKLNATIIHFDVLPDKRMGGAGLKLLTAFRKWAENRGVFELCAGVNSGENLEQLDKFFTRLGFERTGGNYAMRLA